MVFLFDLLHVCYGNVGCSFDLVCYLCTMGKLVAHLIRFYYLCFIRKSIDHWIRFAVCVLLESRSPFLLGVLSVYYWKVGCLFNGAFLRVSFGESRLLIGFSLLSVRYWKVVCLFHGVFCLCVMGKSVVHLIGFALGVLWDSRLLI